MCKQIVSETCYTALGASDDTVQWDRVGVGEGQRGKAMDVSRIADSEEMNTTFHNHKS